ncbi:MAG: universal stress protein [Candidatus Omnitrophota bacterium]
MIKNIIVAVADGPKSLLTAKYAIYLARLLQAKLTAVYVIDEKSLQELLRSRVFVEIEAREYEIDLEQQGRFFIERVKALAENKKIEFEGLVLKGGVHDEVINKAREIAADLLVMGDLKEVLSWQEVASNDAERILRESPCPVVVVKNPQEAERLYRESV